MDETEMISVLPLKEVHPNEELLLLYPASQCGLRMGEAKTTVLSESKS